MGGLAATSAALGVFGGVALGIANGAAGDRATALYAVRRESAQGCPGAPSCGDFTAADGRVKTMTALSIGAFLGAGLAVGGAGTALYVLAPKPPVRVGSAPDALISIAF